jgi:hypothetical protein
MSNDPTIISTLKAMTPHEVYLQQVKAIYDGARAVNDGVTYVPAQLGGLTGQRQVIEDAAVVELIIFEVK